MDRVTRADRVTHELFFVTLICCQIHDFCSADESKLKTQYQTTTGKVKADGLHNVFRISEKLLCGSSPDGAKGFASLQKLGVKTVITVDGARPDVETARNFGLRYVQLPIGYDGVPREQAMRIARAVRDLPGPIYLHCHHGKHRGPAAAAVASLFLDEHCTIASAVAQLKRAGTDPYYTGLYAAPTVLRRPSKPELDAIDDRFPEVAQVPALAKMMVQIDERWENVARVRKADWQPPADHPDIDGAHEVLMLREHYREVARLSESQRRGREFQEWLTAADQHAGELESLLRAVRSAKLDRPAADQQFRLVAMDCTKCHAKYRDVPQNAPHAPNRK